jgi:hypothetical protein
MPTASQRTAALIPSGLSISPRTERSSWGSGTGPRLSSIRFLYVPRISIVRTGRSCASGPTDPLHRTTRSMTGRIRGARESGSTGSETRSGSHSIPTPRRSSSATSAGTPGRRSTTAPPPRTSAGRATRATRRSPPTGAQFMQCAQLPAGSVTPPFFTYDHGSGSAVIGGPFYTGTLYPQEYRGNFFFSDYSGNFIKRVMLTRSTGRSRCSPSRRMSPGL